MARKGLGLLHGAVFPNTDLLVGPTVCTDAEELGPGRLGPCEAGLSLSSWVVCSWPFSPFAVILFIFLSYSRSLPLGFRLPQGRDPAVPFGFVPPEPTTLPHPQQVTRSLLTNEQINLGKVTNFSEPDFSTEINENANAYLTE